MKNETCKANYPLSIEPVNLSPASENLTTAKQDPGSNPSPNWLDNQDILQMLHISSRTLQRWRSEKLLPFTRIGSKIFYRESDVQGLLLRNMQG